VIDAEVLANPEIIAALHAGDPKVVTPPKKAHRWWVLKWLKGK
jgi:hypothetical protein